MRRRWVEDEADYIVVGTGAGGATAARVLSEAGYQVLMVEEGPWLRASERSEAMLSAMQSVRGFGSTATSGSNPMPLLQGRLVGGSTAINSGIIWRMPDDVRARWTEERGLGELVDAAAQRRIFEWLERELEVASVRREVLGGNGALMAEASRRLGLPGQLITRNAARCRGAARCLQGCPGEARQSMDVSFVPRALEAGARLHDRSAVRKVVAQRGRAAFVEGRRLSRDSGPRGFRFHARKGVIVAAGAIQTPALLLRSGLRGAVGHGFQAHPGAAVVGRFDEPVRMAFGVTQGFEVPMRERGYKLEALSLPPEMLATRLPGAGAEWQARIVELDHYAQWCGQVRMGARGRVRVGLGGEPSVSYEPTREDLATVREALALLCRMMFAAGATEVFPGIEGVPAVLHHAEEVEALEGRELKRRDVHLVASHLFGTAAAGGDPATSVVGPTLESHELPGLFVMDASALPTNLGVNPQHTIMAVAGRAAEWLADGARRALVAVA
jgi:choline dehydrogenase-like flavoprotein